MRSLEILSKVKAHHGAKHLAGYILLALPFFYHKAVLIAQYEVYHLEWVNKLLAVIISAGVEWFVLQALMLGKTTIARVYQGFQFVAGMAYYGSITALIAAPTDINLWTTAIIHLVICILMIWGMISSAEWYIQAREIGAKKFIDPFDKTEYDSWKAYVGGMSNKYAKPLKDLERIKQHYSGVKFDQLKQGKI